MVQHRDRKRVSIKSKQLNQLALVGISFIVVYALWTLSGGQSQWPDLKHVSPTPVYIHQFLIYALTKEGCSKMIDIQLRFCVLRAIVNILEFLVWLLKGGGIGGPKLVSPLTLVSLSQILDWPPSQLGYLLPMPWEFYLLVHVAHLYLVFVTYLNAVHYSAYGIIRINIDLGQLRFKATFHCDSNVIIWANSFWSRYLSCRETGQFRR